MSRTEIRYRAIDVAGRPMPSDEAAEEEIIAAGLASSDVVDELEHLVSAADFGNDTRRRIWRAMVSVRAKGDQVDVVSVGRVLQERDELVGIGGPTALNAYAGRVIEPNLDVVRSYAASVRGKARRRRLLEALQVAVGEGFSGRGDDAAWIASVESAVFSATQDERQVAADGHALWELVEAEEQRLAEIANGRPVASMPTGWREIDRLLGGLADGETTVVAGRPGMGKTAFGAQLAMQVAASNHDNVQRGVLFMSIEMTRQKILHRLIANAGNVHLRDVIAGRMQGRVGDAAAAARRFLSTLPLVVDDASGLTASRMRSRLRRAQRRFDKPGARISLVVIDYLQRMRSDRAFGTTASDRSREVGETMEACVELAKETGVHFVFLAQLNRDVGKRSGKDLRPRLTDLAESGDIEKHAHNIAFLHRPEYYFADKAAVPRELQGKAEIIWAKARDSQPGLVTLDYVGECVRFQGEGYHALGV